MRLFVAVTVPGKITGELEAAVAPLRSSWPSLRWTGRDAWHLTLARSRAPVDVRTLVAELSDYAGDPWTAEEIYLIRSRPQSRPRYETLGTWPLRK